MTNKPSSKWPLVAVAAFIAAGTWFASQDMVCKPLAEEALDFALRDIHGEYITPSERITMDCKAWWLATYCRAEYAEAAKPGALDRMRYKYKGSGE